MPVRELRIAAVRLYGSRDGPQGHGWAELPHSYRRSAMRGQLIVRDGACCPGATRGQRPGRAVNRCGIRGKGYCE